MVYIETWYKIWCPKCKEPNWICAGDMNDCSVADAEAVKCHACNEVTKLMGDFEMINPENPFTEKGRKSPADPYVW